jgi:hypothetical protein
MQLKGALVFGTLRTIYIPFAYENVHFLFLTFTSTLAFQNSIHVAKVSSRGSKLC